MIDNAYYADVSASKDEFEGMSSLDPTTPWNPHKPLTYFSVYFH